MKKQYYIGIISFLVALMALGGSSALAQDRDSDHSDNSFATHTSVMIDQNGKGRITGTVASVSGSTLNLNSWGGVWAVDISNAKLFGRDGTIAVSEIQNGDNVAVLGQAGTSGWTIAATRVQDVSIQVRNIAPYGTISNVTANGFTLTANNAKTYSVAIASTTVISINGNRTTASAIVSGLHAQVGGRLDRTGSTIAAIRINISVPRVRLSGTVSGITATGFTLTTNEGKTYAVTLSSDAIIRINDKSDILSNVLSGSKAQISGLAYGDSAVTANAVNVRVPHVNKKGESSDNDNGARSASSSRDR